MAIRSAARCPFLAGGGLLKGLDKLRLQAGSSPGVKVQANSVGVD